MLNYLGRISFSFYLYHYPILNYINGRNIKSFINIFIIVIIISILSTSLLEKPIRESKYKKVLTVIIIIIITFFSFVIFRARLLYKKYITSTMNFNKYDISYMIQSPSDVYYNWQCNYYGKMCYCPFKSNENHHNKSYIFENIFKMNVLFLIGDSHLEQWSYLIYPYAHQRGYTILEIYWHLDHLYRNTTDQLKIFIIQL